VTLSSVQSDQHPHGGVTWLEEYVRLGVTGVSIGSNDLTQLILGVDRDSEVLAPLYDERDRAVTSAIRAIVGECQRLDITCSICGQAPSVHPEYAELLVRTGLDSISVNPDAIEATRRNVAAAEQRVAAGRPEGLMAFSAAGSRRNWASPIAPSTCASRSARAARRRH
jgi:phosphoenolpyruvate-protein kinase (PTS system EI component)